MDRRRHYRVDADEPPLELVIATPRGDTRVEAELVNLALGGLLVRVAPVAGLAVPLGDTLVVHLTESASGRKASLETRVVHRQEEARSRMFGLQFRDLRQAESFLTPSLARLLNRRGAFRVTPSRSDGPIRVTLQPPSETRLALEQVVLVDLSIGGLGVDVSIDFELGMARHERLECLFLLPGERMPLAVPGAIRHRTLEGRLVRYGLSFVDREAAAFRRAHDVILAYVMRRQRELGLEVESGRLHLMDLLGKGRLAV